MTMRYLSLFDGIGAACVAWEPLGWRCVGVSEIEPFPIAVTKFHRPHVPHLGDVTKITEEQIAALGRIDLIVGGFPCQDLSVAGKRAGLRNDDGTVTRSGLFFDAMRIVRWAREHCGLRWLLIENVPGLYSSNRGRDFAAVVGEMVGVEFDVPRDGWRNAGVAAGPDGLCEWATLDAQFFNVAQRRVRVFALADFGGWTRRPPILLEPESLRGDSPPSREAGKGVAGTVTRRACSSVGADDAANGHLIPAPHDVISPALKARDSKGPSSDGDGDGAILVPMVAPTLQAGGNSTGGDRPPGTTVDTCDSLVVTHSLRAEGFDASEDGTGRGTPIVPVLSYGIRTANTSSNGWGVQEEVTHTLDRTRGVAVSSVAGVRRLTPRECERLQGFPDDYTLIPVRGKPAADGPRYKALGNSFAVPVVRWIGCRIAAVHALAIDAGKVAA